MSFVNLLPDEFVARRAQRRANVLCAGLLGAVMVGVLAAAVVSDQGYRHTREVRDRVDQSYADATKLIEQLQELEATKAKMLAKAKLTAGLLERIPRSSIVATLTNALPEGASLTKAEMSSKRNKTVVVTKDNKAQLAAARSDTASMETFLTLTGTAATDVEVARFIASMARCPLMDSVDLVYSQEKMAGETPVREFQVTMRLKNAADIKPPAAAEATAPLARADP